MMPSQAFAYPDPSLSVAIFGAGPVSLANAAFTRRGARG